MNTNTLNEAALPDIFDKAFVDALHVAGELTHFCEMELQSLQEGKKSTFALPVETPDTDEVTLQLALTQHHYQKGGWWKVHLDEKTFFLLITDCYLDQVHGLTDDHIVYNEGFVEPGITLCCCQNFLGFEPGDADWEHHYPICCQKPDEAPDFQMPFYAQWEKRYGKARYQWKADQPVLFVYFTLYQLQPDGTIVVIESPENWYPYEPEDYGDNLY